MEIREKVFRSVIFEKQTYVCVDDIPPIRGEHKGIYANKEKPWFHGKKCTIKSGCVAHWDIPLTDDDVQAGINEGAPILLPDWKEFVCCSEENLYVKVEGK